MGLGTKPSDRIPRASAIVGNGEVCWYWQTRFGEQCDNVRRWVEVSYSQLDYCPHVCLCSFRERNVEIPRLNQRGKTTSRHSATIKNNKFISFICQLLICGMVLIQLLQTKDAKRRVSFTWNKNATHVSSTMTVMNAEPTETGHYICYVPSLPQYTIKNYVFVAGKVHQTINI